MDITTETTSFLDLGTGNGALLFALRDDGWAGPMLGVDYSAQSVRFARRIERARRKGLSGFGSGDGDGDGDGDGAEKVDKEGEEEDGDEDGEGEDEEEVDVHFAEHDILHDPATALLDARFSPSVSAGWDVVLDKGTFDAVSLSAETLLLDSAATTNPTATTNDTTTTTTTTSTSNAATDTSTSTASPRPRRVNEIYGSRILPLVREGGLFLVTSCNWTEAELRSWFEDGAVQVIPDVTATSASTATTTTTADSTSASTSISRESRSESQEQQHQQKQHNQENQQNKKSVCWGFEVVDRIEYRSFSFGGVKGQTISTLCFRKVRKERG